LHCLGKLALASTMPDVYSGILKEAKAGKCLVEVEHEHLNCTHSEVGAYLAGIWGLPNPIVEAIAWHHTAESVGSTFSPLVAVYAADRLIQASTLAHFPDGAGLNQDLLRSLGLPDREPIWRPLCEDVVAAMKSEV
jgi:HD-like signal output (HDOD) protein